MAARGRQTDQQNEARGNPSRPGLHLTPDKQAGYMTATEFQIASAIQPLTRAGSIYERGGEGGIRTFSTDCPVSNRTLFGHVPSKRLVCTSSGSIDTQLPP